MFLLRRKINQIFTDFILLREIMHRFFVTDIFAARRPTFAVNTLLLIGIMLLYPLVGALLFSLLNGGAQGSASFLHPDRSMLPLIRMVQSVGQFLVLALPAMLLAAWHTGRKNPFSQESFAFLGIRRNLDFSAVVLAVGGIFFLQPILYTVTVLQDLYLWPSLGEAGAEVVRQRDTMETFIRGLLLVRTGSEFFAVAFVFAFTPAVCEELFFRGYIQQNYTRSMSSGRAVLLTGLFFAFFHLSAANFLPLALLGCYIGYIYRGTGNLAVPFFAHLVNNLGALIFLLFSGGGAGASRPEQFVDTPWWWLVVAVGSFLFVMVIRWFSTASSPKVDIL